MFFLVGYGTKMGLAPMHTWLPDAHSESPSLVSALLFRGAFELRVSRQSCGPTRSASPPGVAEFSQNLFLFFGLLSMAVAATFILGQTDYKRMLAYSSVEHMGILSIGVGLGGAGAFGAALHAINHSLDQGHACFWWPATSWPSTEPRRSATCAACCGPSPVGGAVGGRIPGHHRHAAVRTVPQRVHDP